MAWTKRRAASDERQDVLLSRPPREYPVVLLGDGHGKWLGALDQSRPN